MKRLFLLSAILLCLVMKTEAQSNTPDTTKVINRTEAAALAGNIDHALVMVHKLHIDAVYRDTIDSYLMHTEQYLINRASMRVIDVKPKTDTVKKPPLITVKPKKEKNKN